MDISRRRFVRLGSISALCAGLGLGRARVAFGQMKGGAGVKGSFGLPYEAKTDPVFYFTHETFAPYLNTTFRLSRTKEIGFDATLVAVSDLRARSQAKARAFRAQALDGPCFALTFRAGERDTVSQGTCRFKHPALGTFSLFVVPGESSEDAGTHYGAIINHIV